MAARFESIPINGFRMDTFGRRLTISCGELRSNSNDSTPDDELSAVEGSLDPVVDIEAAAAAAEAPSQSDSGEDAIDDMPEDDDDELEPGDLICRSELTRRSLDASSPQFRLMTISPLATAAARFALNTVCGSSTDPLMDLL